MNKNLLIPLLAYIISLCLPAYVTRGVDWYGIIALILGPIGFFDGHFSWLANLFLLLAVKKYNASKFYPCLYYSIFALISALSFTLSNRIIIGDDYSSYTLSYGYYFWLLSIMSLIWIVSKTIIKNKNTPN